MSTVLELHRQAMDLGERAEIAKRSGESEQSLLLFSEAFTLEREAARLVAGNLEAEPTRSVLHRSAASLAMDCGEYREAERLIAAAMAGNPPDGIADELRDLLEQLYFQRHLDLKGITLEPDELQLSIAGRAVGHGMAESDEFVGRVQSISKLIYRTAERMMGIPFRERGPVGKSLLGSFELLLSVPRARSFAVSLKVGRPSRQMALPGMEETIDPAEVVREAMVCIELFNSANDLVLKESIPEDAYYKNFVGLARQIAPDGENVRVVGFTILQNGDERRIALTRRRNQTASAGKGHTGEGDSPRITVKGTLLYADSTRSRNEIKLVDEQGLEYKVIVPEGMMSDIVRPLWEDVVIVEGFHRRKKILLEDISKAED